MLEKKLQKLLKEAKEIRQIAIENNSASYYNDNFDNLSNFIMKKLNSPLNRNKNTETIVNHFDEILQYIVMSNIDILLLKTNQLMEQPNFKEYFIKGLKEYPYKEEIHSLFYNIWSCLKNKPNKFDTFMDKEILNTISSMNLRGNLYYGLLNKLNEKKQRDFLELLIANKCEIPYSVIEFKGNNKQIIYDNLTSLIDNVPNLYDLMNFVKDNPVAFSQVKEYIDTHEEKAINSIFCETENLRKIKDPTIREIIRLMILDVMKNEKVSFSDITYSGGGFSRILLIGDKVIKLGDRITKCFPNNPYIVAPLLRKELNSNDETCFAEVTERVDTSINVSEEELYQLYKNIRNLGLVWTDIKERNVGRLKRKNIIHWKDNLDPPDDILGFDTKRGTTILKDGDLVVLDADFIYDENDPNIIYSNNKPLYDKFEKRYQSEKNELKKQEEISEFKENVEIEASNQDTIEYKGIHR